MNFNNKFLIGINISAGSRARFWGVDNYKHLLEELSKYDACIIIFSSDNDLKLANQIAKKKHIYPITKEFGIFAAAIMKLDFLNYSRYLGCTYCFN